MTELDTTTLVINLVDIIFNVVENVRDEDLL